MCRYPVIRDVKGLKGKTDQLQHKKALKKSLNVSQDPVIYNQKCVSIVAESLSKIFTFIASNLCIKVANLVQCEKGQI